MPEADETGAWTFGRPKVFVSHSSQDKDAVWPIVQHLVAYAAVPWVDALEMRPGDLLFTRIATAIEGSAYLLVMVSKNSVKSRWVEEEVRQAMSAEFYDNRIRIIPCLLDDVTIPTFLRGRLYCDFSRGLAGGRVEVLRGIHRDRHVIRVGIDQKNPLRLEGESLRRQLSRVLTLTAGKQRFFFFVDSIDLLDEITAAWRAVPLKGDPQDAIVGDAVRKRNAVPFILPNLSCALSKATDVVVEYLGRDAGLLDTMIAVVQRTTLLTLYWFWKHIQSASGQNVFMSLRTVDSKAVMTALGAVDATRDAGHHPARSIEAYAFDSSIDDLLYLGLRGPEGGVFDAQVNVPRGALPRDTLEEYLGSFPLSPNSEIPRALWLRYFVPAIASAHVLECSFSGQHLGHYLDKVGLRKEDYFHIGLN